VAEGDRRIVDRMAVQNETMDTAVFGWNNVAAVRRPTTTGLRHSERLEALLSERSARGGPTVRVKVGKPPALSAWLVHPASRN
jgi:hypothetical protein